MRSAGAEQQFSKKINVQQVRNKHFPEKHTFSRCGTTIFEKNKRSKGLEQPFSKKIHVPRGWNNRFRKKQTFQGVGTIVFKKNKRSKGLEQPFSEKNARSKVLDDGLSQKRQLFGTEIGH